MRGWRTDFVLHECTPACVKARVCGRAGGRPLNASGIGVGESYLTCVVCLLRSSLSFFAFTYSVLFIYSFIYIFIYLYTFLLSLKVF